MTVSESQPLTQRRILSFWFPLAASWVLMTLEGPFVQAAIARLPDPETNLAAFGIVFSLSVTIQSPIIMLLATSTALCRDRDAYRILRRFMIWLNLLLTVVQIVFAFTPVFDWVVSGAMGVPEHIAAAVRPAMAIMILWSAAIGWRRFYQGILIRYGETRRVSYGTLVRLLTSAGTATLLAWLRPEVSLAGWGELRGVAMGSCALMAGVLAEATLVTWLVRPTLGRQFGASVFGKIESTGGDMTMRRVIGFHTPLAATSLLALLSQPLISAGLARMAFPAQSLAAWPVASSVVLFARSFGLAAQEAAIALLEGPAAFGPVRRFAWSIATGAVLLLGIIAFTPLGDLYLREFTGVSAELVSFVVPGLRAALLIPGLTALQSWLRALLMKGESTSSIYQAMGINLVVTAAALFLGVALDTPSVEMATIALTVAMLVELSFLGRCTQRLTLGGETSAS